ncbi:nucleotidyltransferase domain-containing protein [Clostridium sp. FP2]|uniref:nucleotidyltransferase domain-containing protein n=1 Tax=Clostridium sp. FP2 TaxID=2724481 RepID=UPI0013E92EBA|nr:nucleotidyltransferase domain-containing protein [Clostridium sp. FP2]MBZ9623839.1 nucleotidyltransferase domain-containing protein [Clostridium sp. FP2]
MSYPSLKHKNYIESVYRFCEKNQFSMILKGSLAKDVATKYSDIDLIILGDITRSEVDELITLYDKPIMTNFTENPKGILILVYPNNISVDLDIRKIISQEDFTNSKVPLKHDKNYTVSDEPVIRRGITSDYMPNRPTWYKILRLLHKGIIKYLSNKADSAYNFLLEIKEDLGALDINNLKFNDNFEDDIQCIFNELCKRFEVDSQIKFLFYNLFKEF